VKRAVLDVSVLVSAFIGSPTAAPAQLLEAWFEERFALIISPRLMGELTDVLGREKFKNQASDGRASTYIQQLAADGETHEDASAPVSETADPDDDYLVALARKAGADAIVSVDRHLLDADLGGLTVHTPRAFLQLLDGQTRSVK
jgi:putative PIN family toxin of toxin-antitoxin system